MNRINLLGFAFLALFFLGAIWDTTQGQYLGAGIKTGLGVGFAIIAILMWKPINNRWSWKSSVGILILFGVWIWVGIPALWGKGEFTDAFLFIAIFFVSPIVAFWGIWPLLNYIVPVKWIDAIKRKTKSA